MSQHSGPPAQKKAARDLTYVIEPDMVDALWEDANPNQACQKILLEYICEWGESIGKDLTQWDEYEDRYEASELKWIADFIVNNLCFIKLQLKINDCEQIAKILQMFWNTLNLFETDSNI